jgi:hypothetical protein
MVEAMNKAAELSSKASNDAIVTITPFDRAARKADFPNGQRQSGAAMTLAWAAFRRGGLDRRREAP